MGSASSNMNASPSLSIDSLPTSTKPTIPPSYGLTAASSIRKSMPGSLKGKERALPFPKTVKPQGMKIEEKEEGEISSDEDVVLPTILPTRVREMDQRRDSPGPVKPTSKEMTPSESKQYLEIIRNLLHEGFTPESLLKRGASPQYVTQACQDIIDAKDRLWTVTREPPPREDFEVPEGSHRVKAKSKSRSPSPSMERTMSVSSESSTDKIERMTTLNTPQKLIPEQSWNPTTSHVPPVIAPTRPSSVRPIETWKPSIPAKPKPVVTNIPTKPPPSVYVPSRPVTNTLSIRPPISPLLQPHPPPTAIVAPLSTSSLPFRPLAVPNTQPPSTTLIVPSQSTSSLPIRPPTAQPPSKKNPSRPLLYYGDDEPATKKPRIQTTSPASLPIQSSQRLPQGVVGTPAVAAQVATKNALLESRRKVLESMKLRKAQVAKGPLVTEKTPINSVKANAIIRHEAPTATVEQTASVTTDEISTPGSPMTEDDNQRSLEDEVAKLEREMMTLTDSVPMEIDDTEEGEISDTPPPPLLGNRFSSLPTYTSQIKRPSAADLEDRPTTVASRHRAKRKTFGGNPQRPNRLILNLDDDDDDESDEETNRMELKSPAYDFIERERLLAEKEESIRKLQEQIAQRLKAKLMARAATSRSSTPVEAIPQMVGDTENREDVEEKMEVDEKVPEVIFERQELQVTIEEDRPRPEQKRSSTTITQDPSPNFETYQPLLRRYPQLVSANEIVSPFTTIPSPNSRITETSAATDWESLASVILTNRISGDPNAVLCMAEVGGGICADPGCGDVHVEKGMPPTDQDLIDFLSQSMSQIQPNNNVTREVIKAALDVARTGLQQQTQPHPAGLASTSAIATEQNKNDDKTRRLNLWNTDGPTESLSRLLTKARHVLRLHINASASADTSVKAHASITGANGR